MAWRNIGVLKPPAASALPATAKVRPSHGWWKTGSAGSTSTGPNPCIPPRSWMPSTSPSNHKRDRRGAGRHNRRYGSLASRDRREDVLAEPRQLARLVRDRPDEDALDARARKRRELLAEQLSGADGKALPEHFFRAVDRGYHPLSHDAVGLVAVFGDVEPHRRESVGEGRGVLAVPCALSDEMLLALTEDL